MENANQIIALIVTVLGAVTTFYKLFFKREQNRKKEYYDKLLKPFMIAHKNYNEINATDFVLKTIHYDNDSIPKYIFYLIDMYQENCENNKESANKYEEKLKKTLLYDYLDMYPNEYNKKINMFQYIRILLNYLMFALMFLFLFAGALMVAEGVMSFISYVFIEKNSISESYEYLTGSFLGIVVSLAGLIPVYLSEMFSNDIYTCKSKKITKFIDRKVSRYDSANKKYYW